MVLVVGYRLELLYFVACVVLGLIEGLKDCFESLPRC